MNYLNSLNNKKVSFFIIAIPYLLVFSRFFLELFLLLISTFFIIDVIKKKNYLIFKNYYSFFFLIFYSILLISFFTSNFKIETATILLYPRFYLYVLALFYYFERDRNLLFLFFYSFVSLIFILFFDTIFQYLFGFNIIGYENKEIVRITSFFDDEQVLGSFVYKTFTILLLAKFFLKNSSNKNNLFINLSILLTPTIIFLSGERSAMYLFILMISYYLLFLFKAKEFRFLYIFSFISIALISILLINSSIYYDRYINQTIKGIRDTNYSQNRDLLPKDYKKKFDFFIISAQHQNLFDTSIAIYKKNMIFGSGPKSYRYICQDKELQINIYSCTTHPHNYYLQILSEVGILGFILLLLLYLFILIKSLSNFFYIFAKKNTKILDILILGYYFTQFWPITQTGSLFNNWNSILLYLPLSIYFALKKTSMKES